MTGPVKEPVSRIAPYALVLGGGGTKGAYQVGTWRALREIGVVFEAIAGASVGALNAGLIAQDSYELALEVWNDIALDDIVSLPEDLLERKEKDSLPTFSELRGYMLKNHGLDAQPLRDLLHHHIDETKIRSSEIDLGITTYELTNLHQVEIFLEDIPVGQLPDYLLASASFPAFRSTEIEGRRFTDGGIVDNIPYAMVKNRGYRRIIVVDVSGLGMNRRPDIIGTQTVYIKNSIEMGGILDFDPDFINAYMELGYLDTLRVFDRLGGVHYFIQEGPNDREIGRRLTDILLSRGAAGDFAQLLPSEDAGSPSVGSHPVIRSVRATLPRTLRGYRDIVVALAECAALSLDLERVRTYSLEELTRSIDEKAREIRGSNLEAARHPDPRSIFELIKRKWHFINHRESDDGTVPYLYECAFDATPEKRKRAVYLAALRRLFPALTPARIFLSVLERYLRTQ